MHWPLVLRSALDDERHRCSLYLDELVERRARIDALERANLALTSQVTAGDEALRDANQTIERLRRERRAVLDSLSNVTERLRAGEATLGEST